MVLDFENIHVQYGRKEILHGVDLSVEKGKITGIVGPNGCGKSTLLKTVFGHRADERGKDHSGRAGYRENDPQGAFRKARLCGPGDGLCL